MACNVNASDVNCNDSVVNAYADDSGYVSAGDYSANFDCYVKDAGSAGCD